MGTAGDPHARLRAARLYLILECEVRGAPAAEHVAGALKGGVDIVQLRDKEARDDRIVATASELRALCDDAGALLIVNDRADLALECGADGVHVGQDDDRVDEIRRQVGDRLLIGISTHSAGQIAAADASGADYLGVGPVFETPTKPGRRPVGLALVEHAASNASKPWFAIGGIDAGNAPDVIAAGASRIAVVRAIRDADDPGAAAGELRAALERKARVGSPG